MGTLTVETDAGTITCGGFASGNLFCTVRHAFDPVQTRTYVHIGDRTYEHITVSAYIHIGTDLFSGEALLSPDADVAILPLPVRFSQAIFLPSTDFSSPVCFAPDFSGALLPLRAFSDGNSLVPCVQRLSKKGESGYPICTSSGAVNGIICAYDPVSKQTIATDEAKILALVEDAKRLFSSA